MPTLNFPSNPTVGQQYSSNGRTWEWSTALGGNGVWSLVPVSNSDVDFAAASALAAADSASSANSSRESAATSASNAAASAASSDALVLRNDLANGVDPAKGAGLVGFLQSGIGTVARTVRAKELDTVCVFDFMTAAQIADVRSYSGSINIDAAFQSFLTALQVAGGGFVGDLPAGLYRLRGPMFVASAAKLAGVGHAGEGIRYPSPSSSNGTMIMLDHLGFGFNVSGAGLTLADCVVFRPQPSVGPGWVPLASNYDFNITATDTTLDNVLFWGTSKGLVLNAGGRLTLKNTGGQFFNAGLTVVSATDCVRVSDMHAWPYWSLDGSVKAYMLANSVTVEYRRCDGPYLHNFFSIWARTNILFGHDVLGDTTNFKGSNIYMDLCANGIVTDAATSGVLAQFTNVNHLADDLATNACGIHLKGSNAILTFDSFQSTASILNSIRNTDGSGNRLRINHLYITQWNKANGGFGGVETGGSSNTLALGVDAVLGTAAFGATPPFAGAGKKQGLLRRDTFSLSTDILGKISIPHGLTYAPGGAEVSTIGAFPYSIHVETIDSTNIGVVVYSGTSPAGSVPVSGSFQLYY